MTGPTPSTAALSVRDLTVAYAGHGRALDSVDLDLAEGATTAVVGESGSGKTTLLRALVGLTPPGARVHVGALTLRNAAGDEVSARPDDLRGRLVGVVPQDPTRALDPLRRIGAHFRELHRHFHGVRSRTESAELTVAALEQVGISEPGRRLVQLPHELSGGQLQRVLIALALVPEPRILLADEPTSNLDATVQRTLLDLLARLQDERGLTLAMVTHDVAVAHERADQVVVLQRGRVVEHGPARAVIGAPSHAYTSTLVRAARDEVAPVPVPAGAPVVLAATGLRATYGGRSGERVVLDDVSLEVRRGTAVAVVGESGAGKTTLLRIVAGLVRPDAGRVEVGGLRLTGAPATREVARKVQLLGQNPARSLDPRLRIDQVLAEPLMAQRTHDRAEVRRRTGALLERVGLDAALLRRRPTELSGGQLQRVALARALTLEPELLVLDEPVSALDAASRGTVLRLLAELQRDLGVAYLLVSHDLAMVRSSAHEVLVLDAGRIVERGRPAELLAHPRHPRTAALVASVPRLPAAGATPRPLPVPNRP
ncbi:ABC transporter ATP-binding protein [Nocardioides zeae]|uniref:Peptide/nickel transport system ATP-binding protein n=1 Tax=Nocardioides zeae TaxID=1457234 RepID=A0AAJ1TVG2_9ACTN|nr:ABC transporter ATP-binding protein [Nocardioides zeae]MDQ1103000.1 peptide/nickel transport system ATP-binding protein [Nocardioides zeae]